jgi:hypothetical protein
MILVAGVCRYWRCCGDSSLVVKLRHFSVMIVLHTTEELGKTADRLLGDNACDAGAIRSLGNTVSP